MYRSCQINWYIIKQIINQVFKICARLDTVKAIMKRSKAQKVFILYTSKTDIKKYMS